MCVRVTYEVLFIQNLNLRKISIRRLTLTLWLPRGLYMTGQRFLL